MSNGNQPSLLKFGSILMICRLGFDHLAESREWSLFYFVPILGGNDMLETDGLVTRSTMMEVGENERLGIFGARYPSVWRRKWLELEEVIDSIASEKVEYTKQEREHLSTAVMGQQALMSLR
jgi:hypothetical protein